MPSEGRHFKEARRRRNPLVSFLEYALIVVVVVVAMQLVRAFVIEPYVVPTGSMEPTIMPGDSLLAEKVTLNLGGEVEAGDVVVFENPDDTTGHEMLVKRVVAVGGQTVDVRDGRVYVDGEELSEPYAQGSTWELAEQLDGVLVSFPYTVPEGSVWVMGDNREHSADSRYFGAVDEDAIVGIAVLRYWPLDRLGALG